MYCLIAGMSVVPDLPPQAQEHQTHHCYHVSPFGCKVFLSILARPGPVLICVHGGGIIGGSRFWKIPEEILGKSRYPRRRDKRTWPDWADSWPGSVIDIDYRLLVPSSGHDILFDMRALLHYITEDAFPLDPAQRHQLFFIGFSGGGYPIRLASMLAAVESQVISPRFSVLGVVSVCGMGGDMLLDYWLSECRPGTFQDSHREPYRKHHPLTSWERKDLIRNAEVFWEGEECAATVVDPPEGRWVIWEYLHATGSLNDAVSGQRGLSDKLRAKPHGRRAASIPPQDREVYPQMYFEAHPELVPPMLLIHGDSDEVVPVQESLNTYRQLCHTGKAELRLVPGGDHGLRDEVSKELYKYSVDWMLSKVKQ